MDNGKYPKGLALAMSEVLKSKDERTYRFTVAEAMQDRFRAGTTPRSEAYRAGFEEQLRRKIEGADQKTFPYDIPSAEADAYFSGLDHAKEYLSARKDDAPLYD